MKTDRPLQNLSFYPSVFLYCLLAFGITWGMKVLYRQYTEMYGMPLFNFGLIASYGPSLAALALIAFGKGKEGLLATFRSLADYTTGKGWIWLAAFFEPLLFLLVTAYYFLAGNALPAGAHFPAAGDYLSYAGTFVGGIFFWGLSEEIGWRGFLLPRLQRKYSPLTASVILAVIASFWHLNPNSMGAAFSVQESEYIYGWLSPMVERILMSIPFTLVITFIFNKTGGSLLPMILFHSASNTSYFWIAGTFGITGTPVYRAGLTVSLGIIFVVFSYLLIRQRHAKVTD